MQAFRDQLMRWLLDRKHVLGKNVLIVAERVAERNA
jgi:hypothetical protein